MSGKKYLLVAVGCMALSAAAFAADPSTSTTSTSSTSAKSQHPISDSAITTKVKAALLTKDDLKSLHIHVDTKNGVVTLTGTVPSSEQGEMAVDTAKSVEDVQDVKNSLQVKTASK
jgi:hyperosmotically inducible protein